MSERFELLIGWRHLRANRGRGFVSFIATISMGGVALGVAVLIAVLSVMNGFERELRNRILSLMPHATISAFGEGVDDWREMVEHARGNPEIVATAPYIEERALLIADGKSSGVAVTGIVPDLERNVSELPAKMTTGSFEALVPGAYGIVLGSELAKVLGVQTGDRVVMATSQPIVTPAGVMARMRGFKVVGTFASGMYELDRNFAYVHMTDAAKLYRKGDQATGLRLKLADIFAAPRVVRELAISLGGGYYVDDWTKKNANFFHNIQLAKSMFFVILLMVVAVAAFNIVSTLVMVVKDKRSDIAILRTMGATPRSILAIFMTQGIGIGAIGTIAGIVLGVLIATSLESIVHGLEALFRTQFLNAEVYNISDLPAEVSWSDVVKIASVAFLLCLTSTIYPSWRAARTQPAQALRHE
jgi:lipoprotein-releasing system permease protein